MAKEALQVRETISCTICLDLLSEPVTIPCGHSYCMSCIKTHWDEEYKNGLYSCPQCRQSFRPRPDLVESATLALLVEELKKTGLQAAPADHCFAGLEDVACDVCTGRKRKASKSCLQCLASYCEADLHCHLDSPVFKKHKLVKPSKSLQEKMSCCPDQRSICHSCSADGDKGQDVVSAAVQRTERQRKIEDSRREIQQRIQSTEKDVSLLQKEQDSINRSADKAVDHCEMILSQLVHLLEKGGFDLTKQVRFQQGNELGRVRELQEKLKQKVLELKGKDADLEKLSHTDDHNQFLQDYPSLSGLDEPSDLSRIDFRPLTYFEDVTAAVSGLKDKLQKELSETWTNISQIVTTVDVLLAQPELKTRADFLQYACELTIDPNTVNPWLSLSKENRRATVMRRKQPHPKHKDRFMFWRQALSKESLTGRCYWEVEWAGQGVYIAVAYKDIRRGAKADDCCFGYNKKSWAFECFKNKYEFWFDFVSFPVTGPWTCKVGVYLDHSAGILSFYSVSDTMTLLHRAEIGFTQPLYAGLWLRYPAPGISAEFCELK
ncbi:tripartite motif-containing protein 16-like [Cheilinus undulatus]|uniref:tripartite motif-containing protein 16-like n=1 Tax=Cheilinus undulatus TaxID=241271 RepID=UPI001BD242F7|nr:tripartite motif-containing protein 16-like [Cheilinus undulatus]